MPQNMIDAFERLGSCSATLSHRGTVNLPGVTFGPNLTIEYQDNITINYGDNITIKYGDNITIIYADETPDLYDRCAGTLATTLTRDTASVTVNGLSVVHGSFPGASVTAYNPLGLAGVGASDCRIEYNHTSERWELYAVKLVAKDVVYDYRVDGSNKKFQKQTLEVVACSSEDQTDWTDVHTGDDCP